METTPLAIPLQHTYLEVVCSNPWPAKKYRHEMQLLDWRENVHGQSDFPISLPSNSTCSLLPRSFLPALPSSTWIFAQVVHCTYIDTYIDTYRLSFLSVLSSAHKPRLGNPKLSMLCGYLDSNNLYLQLLCHLCPHHIYWSFNELGR